MVLYFKFVALWVIIVGTHGKIKPGKKPVNENNQKKSLSQHSYRQPFSDIKGFVKDTTRRIHNKSNEDVEAHKKLSGTNGLQSKKSDIEAATKSIVHETNERKDKRGFLATLANLLNDAEALTNHRNQFEGGLSSVTHVPISSSNKHSLVGGIKIVEPIKTDKNDVKLSITEENKEDNKVEKREDLITKAISDILEAKTIQKDAPDLVKNKVSIKNTVENKDKIENVINTIENKEKTDQVIKFEEKSKKRADFPSPEDAQKDKNDSGIEYAPIFAMYHGKIVPLGKLPDTSFKKSHTEEIKTVNSLTVSEDDMPKDKQLTVSEDDSPKDKQFISSPNQIQVTAERRSFSLPENTHINSEEEFENKFGKKDRPSKLYRLQQYLKNLDGHIPSANEVKEQVAKDEVIFPEEKTETTKSDILSHIKGLVLDDGKIVTVKGNRIEPMENTKEEPSTSLDSQKFFVSDDGKLNLVKSSSKTSDVQSADSKTLHEKTTEPKTVALSLEVLKDLLKKSDKVSLATLLNKAQEPKTDEDDDPGTIEDFAAGGLKSHNLYRSKHHSDPLIWSDELAAKAQKLAESLADKKALEIATDLEKEGYGENVAKVWATFKDAGEAATKMWYTQSNNYRFDDPHLDENTGQFAQVVWKSTKELGMGVAKSIDDVNNKYVYVTALYRPPGNIEPTLRDNVLPTGNNTVDVYTTFFKRMGVIDAREVSQNKTAAVYSTFFKKSKLNNNDENFKRSKLQKDPIVVKDNLNERGHLIKENET
ncbi:uncharacterized protein LOC100204716 [Hydra vulgaris]|uniref:uncharacterized protein LOC100204716 n=1 Tax=Hydra vulgaris TaxID=6087 RepID=UPI000641206E|nr:uncharacterized protein LOC100204716 [Hydra vulgaris]